jgi:hypothetical protein
MKMVKSSWMAARPHSYFSSSGCTNKVQPFCRPEIITMLTTPAPSCSHRLVSGPTGVDAESDGDMETAYYQQNRVTTASGRRPPVSRVGRGIDVDRFPP